ncbi:MAG: hypothetical protein AB8E15_01780 [Bdellovibrionales bacterium]
MISFPGQLFSEEKVPRSMTISSDKYNGGKSYEITGRSFEVGDGRTFYEIDGGGTIVKKGDDVLHSYEFFDKAVENNSGNPPNVNVEVAAQTTSFDECNSSHSTASFFCSGVAATPYVNMLLPMYNTAKNDGTNDSCEKAASLGKDVASLSGILMALCGGYRRSCVTACSNVDSATTPANPDMSASKMRGECNGTMEVNEMQMIMSAQGALTSYAQAKDCAAQTELSDAQKCFVDPHRTDPNECPDYACTLPQNVGHEACESGGNGALPNNFVENCTGANLQINIQYCTSVCNQASVSSNPYCMAIVNGGPNGPNPYAPGLGDNPNINNPGIDTNVDDLLTNTQGFDLNDVDPNGFSANEGLSKPGGGGGGGGLGGGGGGSTGAGFGGGGGGSSGGGGYDTDVIGAAKGGAGGGGGSSRSGSGGGGYENSGSYGKPSRSAKSGNSKFSPFDLKKYLPKQKKNSKKRAPASKTAQKLNSMGITGSNGLTNFQKVTRTINKKRTSLDNRK